MPEGRRQSTHYQRYQRERERRRRPWRRRRRSGRQTCAGRPAEHAGSGFGAAGQPTGGVASLCLERTVGTHLGEDMEGDDAVGLAVLSDE